MPSQPDASEIGNELLRASARLTRWASRHAAIEVPLAQARLLTLVDDLGPVRIGDLAAADHSSQPTMTTQVQRFEKLGWVQRSPDPRDSRASLITLTPAGRAAIEAARQARSVALAPLLSSLDAKSQRRLLDASAAINDLLTAAASHEAPPHRKD